MGHVYVPQSLGFTQLPGHLTPQMTAIPNEGHQHSTIANTALTSH